MSETLHKWLAALVLLFVCAATLALPACALSQPGHWSALAGSSVDDWNRKTLHTELRAEQGVWSQNETRLAVLGRVNAGIGAGGTDFVVLGGARLEQGALGAQVLMGQDTQSVGMDWTWHPLHWLSLKMGLQHDQTSIRAQTEAALRLNDSWALVGEYSTGESEHQTLLGLRGSW